MSSSDADNSKPDATVSPATKRSRLKRVSFWLGALALLAIAYLVLAPSPIDPVAYTPPPPPKLTGVLKPNQELSGAVRIAEGKIAGPEDVDVDEEGNLFGGTYDGRVLKVTPDGSVQLFAETGGHPLGLHFDRDGNLIVCDAWKGLLSITPDGKITTLATEVQGVPLGFTDDVDVASDGMIYFSDASVKFNQSQYMLDLMEGRPHGRLIRFDPTSGNSAVLLDGLYFANGVALSPHEDFVLVNETYRYRVTRYWLAGPKAGTSEIFIDNLPGFPDGISRTPRGTFWVALFTVRNPTAEWLAPRPYLRSMLAKLPSSTWPSPEPYGFILELDTDGNILRSLHDPSGQRVSVITSVHEHDGQLYLGSLLNHWIAQIPVPAAAAEATTDDRDIPTAEHTSHE